MKNKRTMWMYYWEDGVSIQPIRGYIIGFVGILLGFCFWPMFFISGWYIHSTWVAQKTFPINKTGKNFRIRYNNVTKKEGN